MVQPQHEENKFYTVCPQDPATPALVRLKPHGARENLRDYSALLVNNSSLRIMDENYKINFTNLLRESQMIFVMFSEFCYGEALCAFFSTGNKEA
jgi:hypothetical protein